MVDIYQDDEIYMISDDENDKNEPDVVTNLDDIRKLIDGGKKFNLYNL